MLHIGIVGSLARAAGLAAELGLLEATGPTGGPSAPALVRRWCDRAPRGLEYTVRARLAGGTAATYLQSEPEVLAAWRATREVADGLGAGVIVLESPPAFRASRANAAALRNFVYASRAPQRLAWHPTAPWPEAMLDDLCDELALVHACNPLVQVSRSPKTPYFRLPRRRRGYTTGELERVLGACDGAQEAWVVFPAAMLASARRCKALASSLRLDAAPPHGPARAVAAAAR